MAKVLIMTMLDGMLATMTANVYQKRPDQAPECFPETGFGRCER